MEARPPEKRLQVGPFAIQATRGLLRDERTRRKVMSILLVAALLTVALGLLGRGSWLAPRENPVRFILFWVCCGWITLTALLLALLDILLVRAQAKRTRKELQDEARSRLTPPQS
jgi:fatty acid desaturase